MPKKTTRTTQQRAREEQWRRRVTAQSRSATPTLSKPAANTAVEDEVDETEPEGYIQAEMPRMPRVTTAGAAATAARTAAAGTGTGAGTRTAASTAAGSAAQRRALAASRAARSRLTVSALPIEEEMQYVKSDVRSLVILSAICLAIIIVLAFVLPMIMK